MTGARRLDVRGVTKGFDDQPVLRGVDLDIAPGRLVALLGPSGCGKTTLLRVVAGLERAESGTVTLGDSTLTDGDILVPPERRRIGMVFQEPALFPHLDVSENVAYGLSGDTDADIVSDALAMVGLDGYESRSPVELSGGEQQRVAIARALAPRPDALLLDEPFSNLDVGLRMTVREETRQLLAELEMTTLFVTHDQVEAFAVGDEVAVMYDGELIQQASPEKLYSEPRSPWVAEFVGEANLLHADGGDDMVDTVIGSVPLARPAHGPGRVLVRPEHLAIEPGSMGEIVGVEFYGHDCTYRVDISGTEITVRAMAAPTFSDGDRVTVRYDGPATVAYPKR